MAVTALLFIASIPLIIAAFIALTAWGDRIRSKAWDAEYPAHRRDPADWIWNEETRG